MKILRYILPIFILVYGISLRGVSFSELPEDGKLVVVNGKSITKGDIAEHTTMMVRLFKNKNPRVKPDKLMNIRARIMMGAYDEMYRRLLLSEMFSSREMKDDETYRNRLKQRWLSVFGKKNQTFESLKEKMDSEGYGKRFSEVFEDDLKIDYVLKTAYSNEYFVTELDVSNAVAHVRAFNATANATNSWAHLSAKKAIQRIRAGEDFAKVADELSQEDPSEKNPGGLMDEMVENDLYEYGTENAEVLKNLKPGECSDVIRTPVALEVFKKLRDIPAKDSLSELPSYSFAHIYFRLAYVFPEQSPEEFYEDLQTEKREELNRRLLKEAASQIKIEYPNGMACLPRPLSKGKKTANKK